MANEPLKFNPEEITIIDVDMNQEHFDFAIEVAKDCFGKFGARDDPGMAQHVVDRFNDKYGVHWLAVVGNNHGCAVGHKGNFAHFYLNQRYKDKPRQEKYFVIFKVA